MTILFIGYWSSADGLSEATIRPHLQVLGKMDFVQSILYVSIERGRATELCSWNLPKVQHIPFFSPAKQFFLDKLFDFTELPNRLVRLCKSRGVNRIICRSSPAGAIGYLVWKKTKIPYFVESFEPHAGYMLATNVWKKWDIRYLIQKYFERKIKLTANGLMPVSENYKDHLLASDVLKCPVEVMPCAVDLDKFNIDSSVREGMRKTLGFDAHSVVGVYVGKFGDIYFEEEAFRFFRNLRQALPKFKLIILTSDDRDSLIGKLNGFGFSSADLFVDKVRHQEVPRYLNASDLAFCFHIPHAYSIAYSPIKNGEYWACGLPIFLSEGIGDDSAIVKETGLGLVVRNFGDLDATTIVQLRDLLLRKAGNEIRQLAIKHRNPNISKKVYDAFLRVMT